MGKKKQSCSFTSKNRTLIVEMSPMIPKHFKPHAAADIVLYGLDNKDKLNILLIKRKYDPFANHWALPGGHVDENDQSIDHTALRELAEETGISGVKLRQFHTFGSPHRDPRGYAITTGYIGIMYDMPKVRGFDDAKSAKWFRLSDLPLLAFDHADIITTSKRYLYDWTNGRINVFV